MEKSVYLLAVLPLVTHVNGQLKSASRISSISLICRFRKNIKTNHFIILTIRLLFCFYIMYAVTHFKFVITYVIQ